MQAPDEGSTLGPSGARLSLERSFADADISIYWGSAQDFARELWRRVGTETSADDEQRRQAQTIRERPAPSEDPTSRYVLGLSGAPERLAVGQRMRLRVELLAVDAGAPDALEVPAGSADIYCFVRGDGLHVIGREAARVAIEPHTHQLVAVEFELEAHLRGARSYTVELFVESPGEGPDSRLLRIFQADGKLVVEPPADNTARLPVLAPLDIRVAPQPDFVLHVETDLPEGDDGPRHLSYTLTSRLPEVQLHQERVGQVRLTAADLARLRTLTNRVVQQATDVQPEDAREQMLAHGMYLFDQLFPADTAAAFRDAFWQAAERHTSWTWLIIEDGVSWLPWELVAPHQADSVSPPRPLGQHFHIGRWIEGLGPGLYGEVPFGNVALAHYKSLAPGQEDQDEELRAWQQLLHASPAYGILQVVRPETPIFGLHLLRHADEVARHTDIVRRSPTVRGDLTVGLEADNEVQQARLDLRFKRPVVSLSILNGTGRAAHAAADQWLLPDRVLPLLRAGASAVVGPWWPTSEAGDQVFWATFYDLLDQRIPLGEAVTRSRLAVERALPHRPDWLAYALFGDPRARPYWPEASQGYAALACLNPERPLRPGRTYTFQACLGSRPPIWYQDRRMQVDRLPEKPRALFLAPGLQSGPPEPIEMQPEGRTLLQASVDLTPPAPGSYPLLVHLLQGDEHLKTLQLTLDVRGTPPVTVSHA